MTERNIVALDVTLTEQDRLCSGQIAPGGAAGECYSEAMMNLTRKAT